MRLWQDKVPSWLTCVLDGSKIPNRFPPGSLGYVEAVAGVKGVLWESYMVFVGKHLYETKFHLVLHFLLDFASAGGVSNPKHR